MTITTNLATQRLAELLDRAIADLAYSRRLLAAAVARLDDSEPGYPSGGDGGGTGDDSAPLRSTVIVRDDALRDRALPAPTPARDDAISAHRLACDRVADANLVRHMVAQAAAVELLRERYRLGLERYGTVLHAAYGLDRDGTSVPGWYFTCPKCGGGMDAQMFIERGWTKDGIAWMRANTNGAA